MANITKGSNEIASYMQGKIAGGRTQKSLYVQNPEQWESAKQWAEDNGMSMSEAVFAGLELLMHQKCKRCERIAAILSTGSVTAKVKGAK